MIRYATADDAKQLCEIYNGYVLHSCITFEEEPVTQDEMTQRLLKILPVFPWLVCEEDDQVVGYAYASPWKTRSAYRRSVESTIYLRPAAANKGRGSHLYKTLLEELKQRGFHTVLGGIALPNPASVALHERLGFEKVAQLKQVGHKFGQWIDVGYWQLLLDGLRPTPALPVHHG